MTKAANIEGIEKATNVPWADWLAYLDKLGARDLPHKEIAERAYEKLVSGGGPDNSGWWAQSVAVAYEQHIGRRQPGQRSDGFYEVAASKVMNGTMEEVMQVWLRFVSERTEFAGTTIAAPPTITKTDKRRHWGCNLADGSRLNADVYPKNPQKASLTLTHTKLGSQEKSERWRAYWKATLATL